MKLVLSEGQCLRVAVGVCLLVSVLDASAVLQVPDLEVPPTLEVDTLLKHQANLCPCV